MPAMAPAALAPAPQVAAPVVCPKCGSKNTEEASKTDRSAPGFMLCKDCGEHFTPQPTEAAAASTSGQLMRPPKLEAWRGPVALAFCFREAVGADKFEPNEATREIPVIIIEEGMGNAVDRHIYSPDLLGRSASKFNGIKAFADHPTKSQEKDQPERSVKQIVGFYKETQAETIGGKIKIAATLKVFDGPAYDWAWQLVKEAWAYAKQFPGRSLVGISINAYGTSHVVEGMDGKPANMVDEFTEVQSADIVTAAGAGGGVRVREGAQLLEAVTQALEGQPNGGPIMKTKKTAAQLLKEGEAASSALHGLLKSHHEALKAIHAKILGDQAYAKEYGPAMEKLMKAHEEVLKHAEGVHMSLGQEPEAAPAPDAEEVTPPAEAPAPEPKEEAFKKMEDDYKAGKLTEREKVLFETIQKDRSDRAIRENVSMIAGKIKESGIPEAYQGDLAIICAGKPEADVVKIVEARKALVSPLLGNRGQGAGAGAPPKGSKQQESQLGSKIAASGVKMKEAAKA